MSKKPKYQDYFGFWAERLANTRYLVLRNERGFELCRMQFPKPPFTVSDPGVSLLAGRLPRVKVAVTGVATHALLLDKDDVILHQVCVGTAWDSEFRLSGIHLYKGAEQRVDYISFSVGAT
jgi:hypothetical protein